MIKARHVHAKKCHNETRNCKKFSCRDDYDQRERKRNGQIKKDKKRQCFSEGENMWTTLVILSIEATNTRRLQRGSWLSESGDGGEY